MTQELEKLYNLLYSNLLTNSPVLSGNLKNGIQIKSVGNDEVVIVIDAKYYDTEYWKKTNKIFHTGKTYNGMDGYAFSLNKSGAFGSHNQSEGWVDRVIENVCETIANEIGGEVKNEL